MYFICSQSDLHSNLSLVSRAVPSRPTHPVLGNVLFVADMETGTVSLTAFDLSLGIKTSFTAQVIKGGKVTLPAKLLNDIVSKLSEGEITLSCEDLEEGVIANLTSASGRFQLRGMAADEFPELPQVEDGEVLMLPVSDLLEGLGGSLFAASTDDTKQILTGVHLKRSQDGLEVAATDGHRLAVVKSINNEETEDIKDFQLTIPAKALKELEKILTTHQSDEQVSLYFNDSQIIFEIGQQQVTSRKLDGDYPKYQMLIPTQFSRQVTIDRKRLLNAVDLVSVLGDSKNNLIKFSLDSNNSKLSLSVDAKDVGSAKDSMSAQISGEDIDIAFNVKYLIDGIKSIPTQEITMHLNESNQPVIFKPLGGNEMIYLVMPVQIRE